MKWASALASTDRLEDAVAEAAETIESQLDGASADVVFAFAAEDHAPYLPRLGDDIGRRFPGALLFGCSASGVIGGGQEVESEPALSLTCASLPGVELVALHLPPDPQSWGRVLAGTPEGDLDLIVLADTFTADSPLLLDVLDKALPEALKIGGLCGGAAGETSLLVADQVHRAGTIVLAMRGDIEVGTGVAQGCRPIGAPLFVTRATGPMILELDGKPALAALDGMLASVAQEDRDLARTSLVVGLVMTEGQEIYEQGDFLIRELAGVEPESGAIAIAGELRDNQVVQFHVRDAEASAEDLAEVLSQHCYSEPQGALMFSCRGRGRRFYGRPNHDSDVVADKLGPVPLGGFFANGEIGPVGGRTYLHTYTSSFGLFRSKHERP